MTLTIVSPIPPSVNNYLNYKVQKNPQSGRLFVQAYKSGETILFENTLSKIIRKCVQEENWAMPDKDKYIYVDAVFFFPKHGMDSNNHWKVPLDVLKSAGVYNDDSKVIESAKRLYIDAKHPRMVLYIYETSWKGIFTDQEDFEYFKEKNCLNCKKNPDKCGSITKALQNRITGDIDIDTNTCNVIKVKKM